MVLIAHDCSLGAHHAVNLAFRHHDLFVKVVALSGRYYLTLSVAHYRDLLDGYFDKAISYNMSSQDIPDLCDEGVLARLRRTPHLAGTGTARPVGARWSSFVNGSSPPRFPASVDPCFWVVA